MLLSIAWKEGITTITYLKKWYQKGLIFFIKNGRFLNLSRRVDQRLNIFIVIKKKKSNSSNRNGIM